MDFSLHFSSPFLFSRSFLFCKSRGEHGKKVFFDLLSENACKNLFPEKYIRLAVGLEKMMVK